MIRVILFLVFVALIAFGLGWLADRPGDVAMTWQGFRIETSVMVAALLLVLLIAVMLGLWSLLRMIIRSPHEIGLFWRHRRKRHGQQAVSRGLIAIGAGDADAARKYAEEAKRLAPDEPLTLLLGAQTAQLTGDRDAAQKSFHRMAAQDETKLLGLHGLYIEAHRRQDAQAARVFAEEAARIAPALPWAGQAVLQFRLAAGDWAGAREGLARGYKSGAFDKAAYRRQRAVLLTGEAMALPDSDRDTVKTYALEAVKLAPDLVPAAALAGRFLSEAGEIRKASRLLLKAWMIQPHPDLARAFIHVRFGDSARDRLARAQTLASKIPGHVEGALALARAAIDAKEFVTARQALAPHLGALTQRVALMMAEIEEADTADAGRAREWTARAIRAAPDPAWTADGIVSPHWMPISPVSGRIDAFAWRVPLAQIDDGRQRSPVSPALSAPEQSPPATLDLTPPPDAPAVAEEPAAAPAATQEAASEPSEAAQNVAQERGSDKDLAAPSATPARRARKPKPSETIEPVLPLVHAPDDPGPDALEPENTADGTDPQWRRLYPS